MTDELRIDDLAAREILDSRGRPTVECDIRLSGGALGRAAVPSGASTGKFEAIELRDGGERYDGQGVLDAVANLRDEIAPKLMGLKASNQVAIDQLLRRLDGTDDKSRLGANALLAASLATARAAADQLGQPLFQYLGGPGVRQLPTPQMNIINGGAHADNNVDFQEFMIIPVGADSIAEAVLLGSEIFHTLGSLLRDRGFSTAVGDEGGYAPNLDGNRHALDLIHLACEQAGYGVGDDVVFGLDCAASEFYQEEADEYILDAEDAAWSSDEMIDFYGELADDYAIASIEDGLDESDWDGWQRLTDRLGSEVQLVGDDLFVTNPERLARGIENESANSILIKVNQIGTLTETMETVRLAQRSGMTTVVSHRSGETEDTTIADLAVALASDQIKTGSLSRSERVAKYNQLIRIEEKLGTSATYAGYAAFRQ